MKSPDLSGELGRKRLGKSQDPRVRSMHRISVRIQPWGFVLHIFADFFVIPTECSRVEESLNFYIMREYQYFVYIMASISGTLYIGVTNNLYKRVWQHKNDLIDGFTKKYQCHKLIYFEQTTDVNSAISREKQLKNWNRSKKERLIASTNAHWRDLSDMWK